MHNWMKDFFLGSQGVQLTKRLNVYVGVLNSIPAVYVNAMH